MKLRKSRKHKARAEACKKAGFHNTEDIGREIVKRVWNIGKIKRKEK